MLLRPVTTVDSIDPCDFKKHFYYPGVPIVIKNLSKDWPAATKWNWEYFKQLVGDKLVPLYNNIKTPIPLSTRLMIIKPLGNTLT
jgi:hypothetical protein